MQLAELQRAFLSALWESDTAVPAGLVVAGGISVDDRLDIHRRNIFELLIDVVGAAYPVARSLVGDAAFRLAAERFVHATPPRMPQLSSYGAGFAAHLATIPGFDEMPYVADVARLEWARNEAYFAADLEPVPMGAFQTIPPAAYPDLLLQLHPSAALLASPFPVQRIWAARQRAPSDLPRVDRLPGSSYLLVVRPRLEVETYELDRGDYHLLGAIGSGSTVAQATDIARLADPAMDLTQALARALIRGIFSGFTPP